jgi:hypothetical protein
MIHNNLYDEGTFAVVAPKLNHLVQSAAGAYICQLNEPGDKQVPFVNLHLEDVISAMHAAGAVAQASAIYRRYCDFWLVDGEIELALTDILKGHAASAPNKTEPTGKKARKSKRAA